MNTIKKISGKNLPIKFPTTQYLVVYLLMDKWQPAEWIWGVVVTISVLWLMILIYIKFNEEPIDVLTKLDKLDEIADPSLPFKKYKFQDKLVRI